MCQLVQLDYRVRVRIFQSLMVQVSRVNEENYSHIDFDACYQLAWCYKIGFGTEKDDDAFGSWLLKSKRDVKLFDQELKDIKELGATPLANLSIYSPHTKFSVWLEQGCGSGINSAQYYRETDSLMKAESVLMREYLNWQDSLGLQHPIVFEHASMLATLMADLGRKKDSVALAERTFGTASQISDADSGRSNFAKIVLARAYIRHGELDHAKPLQKHIVQLNEMHYGETHLHTLQSKQLLAVIHQMQNKLKKSAAIQEGLLSQYSRILGEDHGITITTLLYLSRIYVFQRNIPKAQKITKLLVERAERTLGEDHEMTIMARIQLSRVDWTERKYLFFTGAPANRALDHDIRHMCEARLGENHPYTLEVMWNTARILFLRRQVEKAIVITSTIVKRAREGTGDEAWETKFYQGKLDKLLEWHKGESMAVWLNTFDFGRFVITPQIHPPPELRRIFHTLYRRVPQSEVEHAGMMYDRERNIDKSLQSVPKDRWDWRNRSSVPKVPSRDGRSLSKLEALVHLVRRPPHTT